MNILFINGSPNKNGNTVKMAEKLFYGICRTIWSGVHRNGNEFKRDSAAFSKAENMSVTKKYGQLFK